MSAPGAANGWTGDNRGANRRSAAKGGGRVKLQKAKRVMWGLFGAMGVSMILAGLLGCMPRARRSAILLRAFSRYRFSHGRCPHCGEYLGRVGMGIQLCPYCHERLDK